MKIQIWHNILWSRYKGAVFTELNKKALERKHELHFIQICETDVSRKKLSEVDLTFHKYPYNLIFKGSYHDIPLFKRVFVLFFEVFKSDADLIALPGYHSIEFIGLLVAALITRKKIGLFCDSTIYDRPQSFLKGLIKRLFFYFCDFFMCYGIRSRDYLIHYGVKPENIFFRCQAAALPTEYDSNQAKLSRLKLAANIDQPRFLYVGRLSKEKDISLLLRAFSNSKKALPLSKLILIGDGNLKADLKKEVERLSIVDDVEFLGSKSGNDLYSEFSKATCLVLPSSSEPWGLVVNESLAYGCPVIVSSNCGCVPELVENHNHGLIFMAGNLQDLQMKLEQAPAKFINKNKIADCAIDVISQFTPARAAEEILLACLSK